MQDPCPTVSTAIRRASLRSGATLPWHPCPLVAPAATAVPLPSDWPVDEPRGRSTAGPRADAGSLAQPPPSGRPRRFVMHPSRCLGSSMASSLRDSCGGRQPSPSSRARSMTACSGACQALLAGTALWTSLIAANSSRDECAIVALPSSRPRVFPSQRGGRDRRRQPECCCQWGGKQAVARLFCLDPGPIEKDPL